MGRKTIADLEEENKALKEQLEAAGSSEDLEAENNALKAEVVTSAEAKAASEARLLQTINDMENMEVVNGQILGVGVQVFTGDGYTADLEARRIKKMGKLSIEVLRASINSDWSPAMVMREFGLSEADLQQVVWRLSERELRDRPIKLDFKRDLFGKEG